MSNQVKGFHDLISERKTSPLKFAWDKFKEIGAIRTTAPSVPAAKRAGRAAVDPIHRRAQEYQTLVTKKNSAGLRLVPPPAAAAPKAESRWAEQVLSQGLHQSNPQPRQDLAKAKAAGILFLYGA